MKTIDTRDLYKRQLELQDLKDALEGAREELDQLNTSKPGEDDSLEDLEEWESSLESAQSALDEAQAAFGTDEQEELEELDNLESEIGRSWSDGESMIPEDEFEDYARELADDLGSTKGNEWPFTCIDWERAARELAMDYATVSYQGEDYYVLA
jgi:DNA repair exonuclease SbcCD ATPase subunit